MNSLNNNKSILISVEGPDGSGKSTLSLSIKKELEKKNLDILLTQEPGGTELGKTLRKILHERKSIICDKSEFLLFAAARAQHFKEVIIPELKKNKIIISDRLGDSSVAYQGYARGLDIETIKLVNTWAMSNLTPDIIIYIKLDFKTAIQRIINRGVKLTSFEKEKELFFKKVNDGFDKIFKHKKNVIELDGKKTIEELTEESVTKILKYI